MSDGVWQDDEILADIQRLARGEQEISSGWLQELRAAAGRPMQHQHGVAAVGSQDPKRPVMQSQVEFTAIANLNPGTVYEAARAVLSQSVIFASMVGSPQ